MNRKVIRTGMAVALLGLVSPFAMASTITFDGEVTDQTCTFSVAGNTDPIVLLPSVAQSDLAGGVGNTAGETKFTIEVTGYTPSQTAESFKTVFSAVGPVTTNGNLDNTSANGATGVSLQLFETQPTRQCLCLTALPKPAHLRWKPTAAAPRRLTPCATTLNRLHLPLVLFPAL